MRRRPERWAWVAIVVARLASAETTPEPQASGGFLSLGNSRSKDPITITADRLEYEYKDGVIVYRGDVRAVQGDVKMRSDELRITLAKGEDGPAESAGKKLEQPDAGKLREVIASGNVRIDQGARWAVGGRATFDQQRRTLVLSENPVLHDGPNEVAGDRVIVFLDENRSVVEGGGRKRVKAVLFPGKDGAQKAATP